MPVSIPSSLSLLFFLAITFLVAAISTQFAPGPWYEALEKPLWTPPNWVFAPVWSILYTMMAVSAWMVWRQLQTLGWQITLWLAQLALNSMWSWLFFGLQRPGLAAVEIMILLATIIATIFAFFQTYRPAGLLLAPYATWVTFAAVLNLSIWRLNS